MAEGRRFLQKNYQYLQLTAWSRKTSYLLPRQIWAVPLHGSKSAQYFGTRAETQNYSGAFSSKSIVRTKPVSRLLATAEKAIPSSVAHKESSFGLSVYRMRVVSRSFLSATSFNSIQFFFVFAFSLLATDLRSFGLLRLKSIWDTKTELYALSYKFKVSTTNLECYEPKVSETSDWRCKERSKKIRLDSSRVCTSALGTVVRSLQK